MDDGQFGKIIAHEIPAIREAFNRKLIDFILISTIKLCFRYVW